MFKFWAGAYRRSRRSGLILVPGLRLASLGEHSFSTPSETRGRRVEGHCKPGKAETRHPSGRRVGGAQPARVLARWVPALRRTEPRSWVR